MTRPQISRDNCDKTPNIEESQTIPKHNEAEDNGINPQAFLCTAVLSLQTLFLRNLRSARDIRFGERDICEDTIGEKRREDEGGLCSDHDELSCA